MVVALARGLLPLAALCVSVVSAAGATTAPLSLHREDVDVSRYPWAAIGKVYNETGASCSGVVISPNEILTAAHCLFNQRTRRFISADALHFLLGYRIGHYTAHVRISSYRIGEGFDPFRYDETSGADWAVLTMTEDLPPGVEPLKLQAGAAPSGTKAMIAGYPQDRAFAMTADRDCELRDAMAGGRLLLHTCRGIHGYSGAPILVDADNGEVRVVGIQIAMIRSYGTQKMVAVAAQSIRSGVGERNLEEEGVNALARSFCRAGAIDAVAVTWQGIRDRMELDAVPSEARIMDIGAEPAVSNLPEQSTASAWAWLAADPFAIAVP